MPEYVTGRYLADETVEDREYQTELVEAAATESTLIGLPTGAGKTPVAIRIAMRRLEQTDGRILMVAPQTPLVKQHARSFREMTTLPDQEIQVFNGSETAPTQRKQMWNGTGHVPPSVIIATPQVIENDLVAGRYTLEGVSHLIVDECHRTTGDYAYVYIGERYNGNAENPLVTGMSASPGSNREKILSVCKNLGITNVEIFTEDDEALAKYLGNTEIDRRYIDMPDAVTESADLLREAYRDAQKELKKAGVLNSAQKSNPLGPIKRCIRDIKQMQNSGDSQKRSQAYQCMSYRAEAMQLHACIDKLESQGVEQAMNYLLELNEEAQSDDASKATQRLVTNKKVNEAYQKMKDYDGINPKLPQVAMEVRDVVSDDGQAIVFTESRETVQEIVEFFGRTDAVTARRFVGQSNKEGDPGMTQKEQKEALDRFEAGEHDVLVATSVAEEGLDIPAVDLVLFYEPIPDAVRTIQRRGRTGRERDGNVVILIGRGTSDVAKDQIAKRREDKMTGDMQDLKEMEDDLTDELREEQATLSDIGSVSDMDDDTLPEIKADHREQDSSILKRLKRSEDVRVSVETNMEVADFVVSDRVAVERKDAPDFLDTITGDRQFDQIADLVNNYETGVVMIEADGPEDLYGRRAIADEAIRGALETMYADFGAVTLFTGSEEETANQLVTLARREQEDRDREVSAHGRKKTKTVTDKQEYIVSSIADVGPVAARELLAHFGDVESVFTASEEELREVEGIGETRAEEIRSVLTAEYDAAD